MVVQLALEQGNIGQAVQPLLVQAEVGAQRCAEGELCIALSFYLAGGDEALPEVLELGEELGDVDVLEVRIDGEGVGRCGPCVQLQAAAHDAVRGTERERLHHQALVCDAQLAGDAGGLEFFHPQLGDVGLQVQVD